MRFPVRFRLRPKGAVIVATALGAVALAGVAQAGVAGVGEGKPGPAAVPATAGVVALDNALTAKPDVPPAARATVAGPKAVGADVTPDLAGYTIVQHEFVNPAGLQSLGMVDCPAGTVAYGGGALANSVSADQNINSSYPLVSGSVASGWVGYVNNASNQDFVFLVYAVCAKKPTNYAVVSTTFSNPHGLQTSGSVQCPIASTGVRMKPFGGGALGSSSTTTQNMNSTLPVKSTRSWRADMNNADSVDHTFTVYAVCGLRGGWAVIKGAAVQNPPLSQSFAGVACTAGLTSVGGGLFSSSGNTQIDLNGSYPDSSSSWLGYEDNNTVGTSATITPYVVCLS